MLKVFPLLVALGCPLLLSAQNLIPDGDFETLDCGLPKGWLVLASGASNQTTAVDRDAVAVRGSHAAHLMHANRAAVPDATNLTFQMDKLITGLRAGTEYRLSFYARSPVAAQPLMAYYYADHSVRPHFWKTRSFIVNDTWQKYTFVQRLPATNDMTCPWNDRPLLIRFDLPFGEVFIDDVRLEANGDAAVAVSSPAAASHKNLLVNPGFDLEWLGWTTDDFGGSENPEYAVAFENKPTFDSTEKQAGRFSLRMPPNNCLRSQRYPLEIGATYTLSFYARCGASLEGGQPTLAVFLITPTWQWSRIELVRGKSLSNTWQRYSFPFTAPRDLGSAYRNTFYVRIDTHDLEAWIDSVQVEKGPLSDYDGGIQIGFLHTNALGLYTRGRPDAVTAVVDAPAGIGADQTLRLTARDAYAQVLWSTNAPLAPRGATTASVPVALPNQALGVVDVSAAVLDTATSTTTVATATWRHAVIDGEVATTRPNRFFGMELHTGNHPAWMDELNETIASAAGCGLTRYFTWYGTTTPDGLDDLTLAKLVRKAARKKASGKQTILNIEPPKDCPFLPDKLHNEETREALVAAEVKRFGRHAARIAGALRDTVDYYQLLNEPNIWRNRNEQSLRKGEHMMPPERLIRFIEAGSGDIRRACPGAKIAANISGVDLTYASRLFELGLAKQIDAFTFHAYRAGPETPPIYEDALRLRALVDRYAKGLPLFNDEQYYGSRNNLFNRGSEDGADYFCDSETELAGRVLQTYLHCRAAGVPYVNFAQGEALFLIGISNPVHYYYTYGGYRFMSQLLTDVTASTNVDVHPAVRAFLFERRDGTTLVSLNTRMPDVKGGVRNLTAGQAFDVNGNPRRLAELPVDYLPGFVSFPKGATRAAVVAALKRADFYGFDAPVRVTFAADAATLTMTVENCENKPLDATVSFVAMPAGWSVPAPVTLSALAARATRAIAIPMNVGTVAWDQNYPISYRAVVGDSMVAKSVKLPSIFAPRKAIVADGQLGDWEGVPEMALAEDQVSADFSEGKLAHRGPEDCSATASIAWDEQALYVRVQVVDDVLVAGDGDENLFWQNDSVQIYVDMRNEAGKAYTGNVASWTIGLAAKSDRAMACLDKAPTGRYVGAANADRGRDGDVGVAYAKTSQGYLLELVFPRSTLPYLEWKAEAVLGFSLLVNDNDGTGRKQGVTLGPKGTEPFRNPAIWRTVQLVR